MTTLLIDLGNTALKWTTLDEPDNPKTVVHHGESHFKEELYATWLDLNPTKVVGCTVAAPMIALSATKFFNDHGIFWEWVRPQKVFCGDFTLRNGYRTPSQLGSDRWNAAIGALALCEPGTPLLVVHVGTATTVDTIFVENKKSYLFAGGRIAPGPTLMYKGLLNSISSLTKEMGTYAAIPDNTADAITTAIVDAQIGLICQAMLAMEQSGEKPQVLLAGGAAQFIAPYLRKVVPNLMVKHNLVLQGLALRAVNTSSAVGK